MGLSAAQPGVLDQPPLDRLDGGASWRPIFPSPLNADLYHAATRRGPLEHFRLNVVDVDFIRRDHGEEQSPADWPTRI